MSQSLACIGGLAAHQILRDKGLLAEQLGPQKTPYGDSQPVFACESPRGPYYFLARYGECDAPIPPRYVNYRANLHALKALGVSEILAWNDCRAISHNYRVGEFVIVDDLIDETVTPPVSFFETLDMAHVRQWPIFCPTLRNHLATALGNTDDCEAVERGVYVCVEGHRQETPAESRKFASYGGDLIGRALAPEAFLARELDLPYACVGYVAAYAETGSSARPFERGEVLAKHVEKQRVDAAVGRLPNVLERLVQVLHENGKLSIDDDADDSETRQGRVA
jgi:5'-methylthioadenosine phosphorylase